MGVVTVALKWESTALNNAIFITRTLGLADVRSLRSSDSKWWSKSAKLENGLHSWEDCQRVFDRTVIDLNPSHYKKWVIKVGSLYPNAFHYLRFWDLERQPVLSNLFNIAVLLHQQLPKKQENKLNIEEVSPPVCHSYFQNKLLIFDSIFEHNYIEIRSFPTLEAEFSNRIWTRESLHPPSFTWSTSAICQRCLNTCFPFLKMELR